MGWLPSVIVFKQPCTHRSPTCTWLPCHQAACATPHAHNDVRSMGLPCGACKMVVPAISNYSTTPICAAQLLLYFPSVPSVPRMQLHDCIHGITLAPPCKRLFSNVFVSFWYPSTGRTDLTNLTNQSAFMATWCMWLECSMHYNMMCMYQTLLLAGWNPELLDVGAHYVSF